MRKESQLDSQGSRDKEIRAVRPPHQPDSHQLPSRRDMAEPPHMGQEREGERDRERREKEKGRESLLARSPRAQSERQPSDPARETDEAAFVPDYSESEGSGEEGRMGDKGLSLIHI